MAVPVSVEHFDAARLQPGLDDAFAQVAGRFKRREVRLRARSCVQGMLSGLERKNGWTLAEYAGERTPDGMQRLFNAAVWDEHGVRDDIRTYVLGHLGDPGGVLIGDDTGFVKAGTRSAGVQRQYTGTAGKITNCQIGVYLAYASPRGRALIDRDLYLPRESWIADADRCAAAKIGPEVGFRTKPQLLQAMIERALAAGVPFAWVTADEAYGDNGPLRRFLEDERLGYVMAVSRDHQISTAAGKVRADVMATRVPRTGWQRLSCGAGSKGERWYDWALVATAASTHRLLIRRSISRPSELAFYLASSPRPAALRELVRVAGTRWAVEECFQAGKNEAALDHYQVRLYRAWYRYSTIAMLALAFLAVTRAGQFPPGGPPDGPATGGEAITAAPPAATHGDHVIALSANEIRRLFALLTRPSIDHAHVQHWSAWRLRHQTRARRCHYQRRRLRDH
ncbi:SRSO17 transposase [Sinosporangium album]|uniref:SRSO17 transposase n=1 Tax=Sinosporangium album TaxID=504805 RepID=A0A1G8LV90_9ACTN|nr:SRSO17 transposase [Sinosporangium album]